MICQPDHPRLGSRRSMMLAQKLCSNVSKLSYCRVASSPMLEGGALDQRNRIMQ
jgi:hypothetical protein